MKQLYNEGRVLGLSAYELYYRNAKYYDPDRAPASEKEWLSSTLAMGSSLLLKVGTTTKATHGYTSYFIDLPENSRLTAANTIIASLFLGEAYVPEEDGNGWGWATKVTDYGKLIDNSEGTAYHPSADGTYVPGQAPLDPTDEVKDQIKEYAKIMDGIVLQPGTWAENENNPPYMDYTPDLSKGASIRFSIKDKITKPFYILLTGFTNKIVDAGESGFDSPVNSPSPADGDFLGPWQFPWAAKIIFTVSNAVLSYALDTDEKVEDLQALQLYNTPYLYMFKAAPGGLIPTPEDLEDVHNYILNQKIYGYMSDTFISRYCMSANDVVNNFGSEGAAPWFSDGIVFFNMYNQVEKNIDGSWKYGENAINSPYKYFLWAGGKEQVAPSQQYYIVPIDSRTGMIAVTLPSAKANIMMKPTTSESALRYASFDMTDKLDYLGSWWNGTLNQSDPNLATWGSYVDHPTQKASIPDVTAYYQPYSVVPKPPVEYGYDYYAWLSNTPAYDTMIAEEYWNTTSGINEEKIHISYKELSCMEFLRAAATKYLAYDIDSPDALQVDLGELTFRRFLVPVDAVNATIEGGLSDGSFAVPLEADVSISATIDAENFFAPADITITTLDTENPTDVTSQYRSTKHNIWCSVGNVNEHFTKSVSLIDQYGTPLSLQGSSSKQSVDEIVWVDLLDALNHNKSLDILGSDMKALKTALNSAEADKTYGFKKNADGTFELVEVGE